MVVPLRDHFWGTDDPAKLPLVTTGPILREMQIDYWRGHWRHAIPPMSREEFQHLRQEHSRITLGKSLKYIGQLEFMSRLLSPPRRTDQMQPIALRDSRSGELIRDGRWRGIVGTQHERDAYVFLTQTSVDQELDLVGFLEDERHAPFNRVSSNCSEFIARGLAVLFRQLRHHTQTRLAAFHDSFIKSPSSLASNFVRFTKKSGMPLLSSSSRSSRVRVAETTGSVLPRQARSTLRFIKVSAPLGSEHTFWERI